MINEQYHIDLLITRYLSGEASAEEAIELDDWRELSHENEKYYMHYQYINNKAFTTNSFRAFDTNNAWRMLHNKMQQLQEPIVTRKKTVFKIHTSYFIQIAATIILLIAIATVFNYYYKDLNNQSVAQMSNDSMKNIILADNSTVYLNKNSKITYSKNYGENNRKVTLQGEAHFNVKHSNEKPFIVETEGALIQDIGTAFNVKAKIESFLVEVYVEEGEVQFFTQTNKGLLLKKGEKGIYNKRTKCFSKEIPNNANDIAYKTRRFVFNNTQMNEVVDALMDAYNVKIEFNKPELAFCKINVTFDNENIESILAIIAETINGNFEKTDAGYLIDGKRCVQ